MSAGNDAPAAGAGMNAGTGDAIFEITRVFDAPRERVWTAWSNAGQLQRWWGPKGCAIDVKRLEFRAGGFFHYAMTFPGAPVMWGRFNYREIVPGERIVWLNSFANENCGIVRAPFAELSARGREPGRVHGSSGQDDRVAARAAVRRTRTGARVLRGTAAIAGAGLRRHLRATRGLSHGTLGAWPCRAAPWPIPNAGRAPPPGSAPLPPVLPQVSYRRSLLPVDTTKANARAGHVTGARPSGATAPSARRASVTCGRYGRASTANPDAASAPPRRRCKSCSAVGTRDAPGPQGPAAIPRACPATGRTAPSAGRRHLQAPAGAASPRCRGNAGSHASPADRSADSAAQASSCRHARRCPPGRPRPARAPGTVGCCEAATCAATRSGSAWGFRSRRRPVPLLAGWQVNVASHLRLQSGPNARPPLRSRRQ